MMKNMLKAVLAVMLCMLVALSVLAYAEDETVPAGEEINTESKLEIMIEESEEAIPEEDEVELPMQGEQAGDSTEEQSEESADEAEEEPADDTEEKAEVEQIGEPTEGEGEQASEPVGNGEEQAEEQAEGEQAEETDEEEEAEETDEEQTEEPSTEAKEQAEEPDTVEIIGEEESVAEDALEVVVVAPVAMEGLVYTGEPQALVDGEGLMYSLDGEHYAEEIPTAIDAGEYTVFYRADEGEAEQLTVTVAKADVVFTPPTPIVF